MGTELNYGAADNLQVTLGLPVAFSHDATSWRTGADDIKFSVKFRVYQNEDTGVQLAVFPGVDTTEECEIFNPIVHVFAEKLSCDPRWDRA